MDALTVVPLWLAAVLVNYQDARDISMLDGVELVINAGLTVALVVLLWLSRGAFSSRLEPGSRWLALGVLASIWLRSALLPGIGFVVLLVLSILMGGLYPAIVQSVSVNPNASDKEKPFIARNIAATREAYDIIKHDKNHPNGTVYYQKNYAASAKPAATALVGNTTVGRQAVVRLKRAILSDRGQHVCCRIVALVRLFSWRHDDLRRWCCFRTQRRRARRGSISR